jgi:hypothetical protein
MNTAKYPWQATCRNKLPGVRGFATLPLAERFWEKVDKGTEPGGCWLWLAKVNYAGRGRFYLNGKYEYAPRVSWMLTHGELPGRWELVLHRCDNPRCVRPDHLFLGTDKTNSDDMMSKGRRRGPYGHWHPHSKLTEAKVIEMRQRYQAGESFGALAKVYGVTSSVVKKTVLGINWKHVPMPAPRPTGGNGHG